MLLRVSEGRGGRVVGSAALLAMGNSPPPVSRLREENNGTGEIYKSKTVEIE